MKDLSVPKALWIVQMALRNLNCHCFHLFCNFQSLFVFPQQAEEENELRKKQEQALMEKLLEQEALMEQQDPKVRSFCSKLDLNEAKVERGMMSSLL